MQYANKGGNSAITYTNSGTDFIVVRFDDLVQYTYTNESAGKEVVTEMQKLADAGQGLGSYITRNKPPYSIREKLVRESVHVWKTF